MLVFYACFLFYLFKQEKKNYNNNNMEIPPHKKPSSAPPPAKAEDPPPESDVVQRCNCNVVKASCPLTREELRSLLEKQLEGANGDTTDWHYTEGDFEKILCVHHGNKRLHHHKSCGMIIDLHRSEKEVAAPVAAAPVAAPGWRVIDPRGTPDAVQTMFLEFQPKLKVFAETASNTDITPSDCKSSASKLRCVVCGFPGDDTPEDYPCLAGRHISFAHIARTRSQCVTLGTQFDATNFIPLCGAKDEFPSCHHAFDHHLMSFVCMKGSVWTVVSTGGYESFNGKKVTFEPPHLPHRRALHVHAAFCCMNNVIPSEAFRMALQTIPMIDAMLLERSPEEEENVKEKSQSQRHFPPPKKDECRCEFCGLCFTNKRALDSHKLGQGPRPCEKRPQENKDN